MRLDKDLNEMRGRILGTEPLPPEKFSEKSEEKKAERKYEGDIPLQTHKFSLGQECKKHVGLHI